MGALAPCVWVTIMTRFGTHLLAVLCTVFCSTCAALPVAAATISLLDVQGRWISTKGSSPVTGLGTRQIRWGGSLGKGPSGYDFKGIAPSGPFGLNQPFAMGIFTHLNRPVRLGGTIKGATLKVDFTFLLRDGDTLLRLTRRAFFDFRHWETGNQEQPCGNRKANGRGKNRNGCADRVMPLNNLKYRDSFVIDRTRYTFDVTGFNFGRVFWTREGAVNRARLFARLTARDFLVPPPPAPVPLPAGLGLLGLGLAALSLPKLRRRKA